MYTLHSHYATLTTRGVTTDHWVTMAIPRPGDPHQPGSNPIIIFNPMQLYAINGNEFLNPI